MTDTAFYQRMGDLATRLISKFGASATLRSYDPKAKPNSQGVVVPGAATDTPALAAQTQSEAVLDMLNAEVDAALVFKCPRLPTTDMQVLHGNHKWNIKSVKEVSPDGVTLIVCFLGVTKA